MYTLQYHQFFYLRFLTLWLGLVPTRCLVVFFTFFQCKHLHAPMALDLLDSSASTYDLRHIFGSNMAVAENSTDPTLLVN